MDSDPPGMGRLIHPYKQQHFLAVPNDANEAGVHGVGVLLPAVSLLGLQPGAGSGEGRRGRV